MAKRKTTQAEDNGHLQDGTITIEVQGGPHDGKTISMDATVVMMVAGELTKKHKLKTERGMTQATPRFAIELDEKLQEMGYSSTPTIAVHAWVKACEYFAAVQKKTSRSRS